MHNKMEHIMNKHANTLITNVEVGSIAEEVGIEVGDTLISINEQKVMDIFDYRYLINDYELDVLIEKADKTLVIYEIDKEEQEDLGISFESDLIDKAKSCSNKCVFCFIDQLPKNMRETLYFKDDDTRLSFLTGNYVTLTNVKKADIDKVIYYHLSPINISVHASDGEIRKQMLGNKKADKLFEIVDRLHKADISMNFQVVLCKDINDGANLDKTIEDLSKYIENHEGFASLSIVPVGLTKHREKLFPLKPFTKQDCRNIISKVGKWQKLFLKQFKTAFVFLADEFYLKAEMDFPDYTHYENFPQLENGVGMIKLFEHELDNALLKPLRKNQTVKPKTVSIVTGISSHDFMLAQCSKIASKYPQIVTTIHAIQNDFFGEEITVSGLLTGADITAQLQGKPLGDVVLIPENAMRANETVFLDDVTIEQLQKQLGAKVKVVENNGEKFLKELMK